MKHEKSRVKHNYGCVYMQTAAASIAKALDIESKGITLLSPVFDLDFGQEAMASAMLGLSKILGIPKPFCAKALLSGAMAVRRHTAAVEKQGKALLATLRPDDKVLVLITRNYGVSDPILNMGIADSALPNFSGGNGRYRYAKAVELSNRTNAVLTLAPRYENTAMILDMRGLHDACRAPLFQISLDNDWDETAWSRLRSFLYYC